MTDISSTRLLSLQNICKQKSWGATELAVSVGHGTASYWSQLLKGQKSFGEKAARRVEEALGLTPGYLDAIDRIRDLPPPLSKKAQLLADAFDQFPDGPKKELIYEVIQQLLAPASK